MEQEGVYCTTAGTVFQAREDLQEHYQTEFHRYNLKRKIAGLPPVTREWYDARKSQIEAASGKNLQKVWFDPLSKRRFSSENTYLAFTRSKKYQEMVKKSGRPAPEAVITIRRDENNKAQDSVGRQQGVSTTSGAVMKPISGSSAARLLKNSEVSDSMEIEDDSEWETASEEEEEDTSSWEKWDICRSLFDNNVSSSMEENLEYMWKKYGFYLPDSKYLKDPEGLLQYLGAKMQYGKLPLYESGLNPDAKRMASLHGVQRHMVDSGKCKMFYEGNEDEYEDYYDYEDGEMPGESEHRELILSTDDLGNAMETGFELTIPGKEPGHIKILGTREFARYYRQRHRVGDTRASAVVSRIVSKYQLLTVPLLGDGTIEGERRAQKKREEKCRQKVERVRLAASLRRNINDNLPKNVPY